MSCVMAADVRTSIRGFLTRAQLKVLFEELEKEMQEEELLADIDEAARLGGAFSTIIEESSYMSTASSAQEKDSGRPPTLQPSSSRLQINSAQTAVEGEKQFERPSAMAFNAGLTEEPGSASRRTINERLTQSRRDLFRQVTTARNTGAIVDIESLIKKHQDVRFPARASLTSTPLANLDPSPNSSGVPNRLHPSIPELVEPKEPVRRSRFDDSEDQPSIYPPQAEAPRMSPARAVPALLSVMEEASESLMKEAEEEQQEAAAERGGPQTEIDRSLSQVLDLLSTPRPTDQDNNAAN